MVPQWTLQARGNNVKSPSYWSKSKSLFPAPLKDEKKQTVCSIRNTVHVFSGLNSEAVLLNHCCTIFMSSHSEAPLLSGWVMATPPRSPPSQHLALWTVSAAYDHSWLCLPECLLYVWPAFQNPANGIPPLRAQGVVEVTIYLEKGSSFDQKSTCAKPVGISSSEPVSRNSASQALHTVKFM